MSSGKRKIKEEPGLIKVEPEEKRAKHEDVNDKENLLRAQLKGYWQLRDELNSGLYRDHAIKDLLVQNEQLVAVHGRDNLLDQLCDAMYFGPLEKCPECKTGQLIFKDQAYKCTGHFTEWTKCLHRTQTPVRRTKFTISNEFLSEFPFLQAFTFVPRERAFSHSLDDLENPLKKEETTLLQPLYKMDFAATSKLARNNPEIKLIIERLGGRFTTGLHEHAVALISNEHQLEKAPKKILQSQEFDIHVVSEKFLDDLCRIPREKINIHELIAKHNIASWGSDLHMRIEACIKANEALASKTAENKFKVKSGSNGVVKLKLKGGAVVDPDSGLEDEGHILYDSKTKEPFSCTLGLVDIEKDTNSYYKIQLIEHDKYKSKWYVFRSWGRVGTTIGRSKLTDYNKKEEAIEEFCEQYLDKTGNRWDDRKVSCKHANKYYPLEIDYGGEDEEEEEIESKLRSEACLASSSKLEKPIQDVIRLIFDIDNMKRQMMEFEIDMNKMPLGKISSNQIKQAYSILTELTGLIDDKQNNQTQILDASNRFYTLIPHDFGMRRPHRLDVSELIKEKTEMLNNLLDIEIAYSILKTDTNNNSEIDPIDQHFSKLNIEMEVLDRESEEFKRLVRCVAQTHAETHDSYRLVVRDIIKLKRDVEVDNLKFKTLHNHRYLWHGSRLTNYAGILSKGLRIAPPEAPSTGYMFGKGVYFADMVSKSANYCYPSRANPAGLLLMCEVALGDMLELGEAKMISRLPKGKNSTMGLGRTQPDPEQNYVDSNGAVIPMGKGVKSGVEDSTTLLYNEFIVYDTQQIQMKYLFRVDFEFVDYDDEDSDS